MRAAVLENSKFLIKDIEKPSLDEYKTGAIVKVIGCGLCGSDIVKLRNGQAKDGDVLGHGVVELQGGYLGVAAGGAAFGVELGVGDVVHFELRGAGHGLRERFAFLGEQLHLLRGHLVLLAHFAVFLHAAQGSVDAQNTVHCVLDGNGLSRWRGRRKCRIGEALRGCQDRHGQHNKKGRNHKRFEGTHIVCLTRWSSGIETLRLACMCSLFRNRPE